MSTIAFSRRIETSSLSLVLVTLKGLRRHRVHAPRRKQLLSLDDHLSLQGLDHYLLRDIGLERLNAK